MNWNGSILFGADIGGGYQFAAPASVGSASTNQSQAIGWIFAKAGGNLFSLFGTNAAPATNSALIADLMAPYAITGPMFVKGATLWANGAGLDYLVGPNLKFSVQYVYANDQNNAVKNVQLIMLGLKYGFKP